MKKIINKAENMVIEMCEGMVAAHPKKLAFNRKYKLLMRKKLNSNKVSLISGGGSGHEPAHAGYVGEGMLDVAVCGDVFASPSTIQVYNAILESESNKGTLLVIKNYSGDVMNFEAAAEMAEEDCDMEVAKVYVNDDIAVKDSLYTVGRRGVAGTVYVHKLAGAAAEAEKSLEEVKAVAEKVINNVRSIGFALTSCTVPAKGTPTFEISEKEIEFGVGIHGEPGVARQAIKTANELAQDCISLLLKDLPFESGDEVALMINGFGATPLKELYVFNNAVSKLLNGYNIKIYDTMVGNYMTSIDMAGASVTMLKLDDELKELLDAPVNTIAINR
ncbi:dihydroxyacetone kinase subunit DhaK [Vallitalea okinawensis]|uniref:dihydroxyacetone kinase subunit DhaK n=1 Tax=Vallitalea okinawensis TaxID=2078660 RepID=UPI0014781CFF|nr:dihydroxyacetone kinase subunit DhaK [Vallitalea okinawensis]